MDVPLDLGCLWRAGYVKGPSMSFPFPIRHSCGKIFVQMQDLLALSKPLLPPACLAAVSPFRGLRVQEVVMYLVRYSVDICSSEIALASHLLLD